MNLRFPLQFDHRGRTAETDADDHIRDLIEQLLFTSPGERVNRPDFGSGLLQLVFEPGSPDLAAVLQLRVHGALQQWLGDLIHVEAVDVTCGEGRVGVTVAYMVRRTQQREQARFSSASS